MRRLFAILLLCVFSLSGTVAKADWGVKSDYFASIMFKMYCLDAKGNAEFTNTSMSKLVSKVVALKPEMASEIFGKSEQPAWMFVEFAKSNPVFIQAKSSEGCAIVTTGNFENLTKIFEKTLSLHAEKSGGKLYRLRKMSFVEFENFTGSAFTIKMEDTEAYPTIYKNADATEPVDKTVVTMMVFFKNKTQPN